MTFHLWWRAICSKAQVYFASRCEAPHCTISAVSARLLTAELATPSQNTVSQQHVQQKLKVAPVWPQGSGRTQTREAQPCYLKRGPQFFFQHKLHFETFFTIRKEQTKEYILFPGLGDCLWSTLHCFQRTCSARFSHCSGHSLGSALQSLGSSTSTFSKPSGLEGLWQNQWWWQ